MATSSALPDEIQWMLAADETSTGGFTETSTAAELEAGPAIWDENMKNRDDLATQPGSSMYSRPVTASITDAIFVASTSNMSAASTMVVTVLPPSASTHSTLTAAVSSATSTVAAAATANRPPPPGDGLGSGPLVPGELMRGEGNGRDLAPLGLLAIILIVLIGNLMVIVSVRLEKRLQRMTFYFLVSMAAGHVVMAVSAMPPAVLVTLAGQFSYEEEMCKLWVTLDLFLCNNTCLHLAFCAMDTFLRLKDPIRHNRPNTTCSLILWMGAPWVISSVQAIAQFMLSQADHSIVHAGICFIADKNFLILGTLFSFLIPAVIGVVFHALSYREVQALRRGKYIEESEASGREYGAFGGSRESLDDDMSDTTSCVSDNLDHPTVLVQREQVQLAVVNSTKDSNSANSMDQQSNLHHHNPAATTITGNKEESTSFCEDQCDLNNGINVAGGQTNHAFADHLLSTDQSASCTLLLRHEGGDVDLDDEDAAGNHMVAAVDRERDCHDEGLRFELMVSRLTFLLLVCCISLWVPFSMSNVVYSVCDTCRLNMTFTEMLTFKWLAYSSAMVGPFAYLKYSPGMREAFYKICTCKYCGC